VSTPSDKPPFIPLSEPLIAGREWEYVKECLDTGWVSSAGRFVERFEADMARRLGVAGAVATASGSAALHVALLLAGVAPDDEVLVPSLTFIATANAVRFCGAWPVFMDAEPERCQMDVGKAADFLARECAWSQGAWRNRASGRRVAAILPVHLLGHPVDMDPLLELAEKYSLAVVEDATQGLGALYKGRPVGALGRLGCLSFNGNKLMTTGGGGMIVGDDARLIDRARYLTTQARDDAAEYVHQAIGFNYRLSNVAAAMGCAQLERLDEFLGAKAALAARYDEALAGVPGLALPRPAPWADSAWWLYTILVDESQYGLTCRELRARLRAAGIESRTFYQPLHLSPAHAGAQAYHCDTAERLWARALSLPSSVGLAVEDQRRVAGLVSAAARTKGV
jgi:perosamine synthetase